MHWLVAALLLPGIWGGILPSFWHNPLLDSFPIEAHGDLRFEVDAARFLEGNNPAVDLCLSVPQAFLGGDGDSVRLLATVEMLNHKGKPMVGFQCPLNLPPARPAVEGAFPVPGQWIRLNPRWVEGTEGVRVRIEDRKRLKVGLADRVRGLHRVGEAAARLSDPSSAGPQGGLSDLLFVWGQSTAVNSGAGGKGLRAVRASLQPNPFRYYGLYQPTLTVYWERYPLPATAGVAPGATLLEREEIVRNSDSLQVHASAESVRVATGPECSVQRYNMKGLPAGSYRFEVSLWNPARPEADALARSLGNFQVVWEKANWILNDNDLLAYGRVLLPARELDHFSQLDRGGMEIYLQNLWNRHAPSRPGEENPVKAEFLRRVERANKDFSGQVAGMLTDRGRILVRYGPPDVVRTTLNPQDQELLYVTLPQEMADDGVSDTQTQQSLSKPRSPEDNSDYEIWEYFVRGYPLLPEYVNPNQKTGLKFIFVDELGNGEYTLAYSNVIGAME